MFLSHLLPLSFIFYMLELPLLFLSISNLNKFLNGSITLNDTCFNSGLKGGKDEVGSIRLESTLAFKYYLDNYSWITCFPMKEQNFFTFFSFSMKIKPQMGAYWSPNNNAKEYSHTFQWHAYGVNSQKPKNTKIWLL